MCVCYNKTEEISGLIKKYCGFSDTIADEITDFLGGSFFDSDCCFVCFVLLLFVSVVLNTNTQTAADWHALVVDLGRQAPFHKVRFVIVVIVVHISVCLAFVFIFSFGVFYCLQAILLGTAGVKNDPSRATYVVIKVCHTLFVSCLSCSLACCSCG